MEDVARSPSSVRGARTRTLAEDEAAVGRRFAEVSSGERIGRYELGRALGAGGMGTVHSAHDPKLERDVAIKLIRPERSGSEQAHARFVREARAMAKLTHPNVVEVYDVGIAGGRPYVVMELVAGMTLAEWLSAEPRSPETIIDRVCAAGRGLVAAHEVGLVHRDFKPSNVLIGDDGRVRVSDFGLARALQSSSEEAPEASVDLETTAPEDPISITRTGALLGSPMYMAPEQHIGGPDSAIDARADQFAFAVTLYQALVGERPFDGPTNIALMEAKLAGPPSIPASSPWLRRHGGVLRRALHPDPRRRWPTMRAMLRALQSRGLSRRTMGYAGGAVGVGLLAFALMPAADARCKLGGERIAGVWNDAREQTVHAALLASGRDHADQTAARVSDLLSEKADAWVVAYEEACGGEPEGLDDRMRCLDGQRERLDKAVTRLEDADAELADRAVPIAAAGSHPSRCLEPRRPDEATASIPEAQREEADAIRETLRLAKRREHLGKLEEANALATEGLERARKLGHPPLIAFALTNRASALEASGNYDDATPMLYEAMEIAETAGAFRLAAGAQIEGVFLQGYRRGDFEEGKRLARQAQAMLARVEDAPQLEASLLNNIGAMHHRAGEVDEACASMAAALKVRENNPDVYSNALTRKIALANARENIGACMVSGGRYLEALPYLEDALEESQTVFGANNPQLGSLHQALSSAYESVGRYNEALTHIDRCITLWSASTIAGDDRLAGAHADRGYALSSNGQLAEAVEALLLAAEIAESLRGTEDPRVGSYRANAVEALVELGDLDRAAELLEPSRRRVLSLTNPGTVERQTIYIAAGRLALAQDDAAKALKEFEAALAESKAVWGEDSPANLRIHVDLARVHGKLDQPREAQAELERAVVLAALEPDREPIHTGEAFFELARAIDDEDPERARELAEQAQDIYAKHAEMPDRLEEVQAWLAMH